MNTYRYDTAGNELAWSRLRPAWLRVALPGWGPGGFRVPDFDPAATIAARGTVVQVKATATLSSSPQLRDLVAFARSKGVPLEIFTNATFPQRGELARWIQSGQIIIQPIP